MIILKKIAWSFNNASFNSFKVELFGCPNSRLMNIHDIKRINISLLDIWIAKLTNREINLFFCSYVDYKLKVDVECFELLIIRKGLYSNSLDLFEYLSIWKVWMFNILFIWIGIFWRNEYLDVIFFSKFTFLEIKKNLLQKKKTEKENVFLIILCTVYVLLFVLWRKSVHSDVRTQTMFNMQTSIVHQPKSFKLYINYQL